MQKPTPFTAPTTVSEQSLIQSALDHVRAIMKGNGVKQDSISVASHKISHHTLNAGTYLELRPATSERQSPGKLSVGLMVASRDEASKAVDQAMVAAANDPTAKAQIASVLLSRPDQGFGLSRQTISLDFLKKEFTWHEGCSTCNGTANAPCQRCHGRKVETCSKCSGRGLMACPLCRTTGLLQGQKCTRCHGQRYVPCDLCQRTGMMACRVCHATGVMKCATCAGQGWKTHTLTTTAQALTYFEFDGKSMPKGAADMFETQAPALAVQQRIKVTGRIADDKENVLGANYDVEFPYGDLVFMIGKNEIKANLFGYKGELINFPYVIDKVVLRAVEDLEEAARDVGDVAGKIRNATRYRVIAQGFLTASRMSAKKTVEHLLKIYDIGLSQGMAEKIAVLADQTTARITRKPRYYGLIGGLILVAAMDAAYYLLPVRSKIAGYLPNAKIDFVLDLLPLVLGGIVTTIAIQMAGAGAIRKALGHLIPKGQKNTLASKAGSSAVWGWAGTLAIMLGLMEYTASHTGSAPYWYEIARNFVMQILG
jgi:hypothetical protein